MRITNKIMQNNSLYNINNNKITEDLLNTQASTGKKINRPSDDPVVAIRALRLRSNVAQLNQYYEKNVKDARSFLEVSGDALDSTSSILTDFVKQATKGANKDLTLSDIDTIVTQMEALSEEFYLLGNTDFAGRYVFIGFRTDTPLCFDKITTKTYENIEDNFESANLDKSFRMTGDTNNSQENMKGVNVSRLRLSYDTLNYKEGDRKNAEISFNTKFIQPATSSVTEKENVIKLSLKLASGDKNVFIPTSLGNEKYIVTSDGVTYDISKNENGNFVIEGKDENENVRIETDEKGHLISSTTKDTKTSMESVAKANVTYMDGDVKKQFKVPMLFTSSQSMEIDINYEGNNFKAVVNSDGTITVKEEMETENNIAKTNIVNLSTNGSIYNSYIQNNIEIKDFIYSTTSENDIDNIYKDLSEGNKDICMNADTGEILFSDKYAQIFSNLSEITNADTIKVSYDKNEWKKGDIIPEHLFTCEGITDKGVILYNKGVAAKDLLIDVGFNQSVKINTNAGEIFTSSVKRDVADLRSALNKILDITDKIKVAKENGKNTESLQKTFDYLREDLQKMFERKITSMQKTLDKANVAVTDNGTRNKRLDMIEERLMNQTTTFKTLKSENEDIDFAETITQLTNAQLAYEASLMATGKISQSSLINFI